MLTDAQLVCVLAFGPIVAGCLLAAVVETFNIYRRETSR